MKCHCGLIKSDDIEIIIIDENLSRDEIRKLLFDDDY